MSCVGVKAEDVFILEGFLHKEVVELRGKMAIAVLLSDRGSGVLQVDDIHHLRVINTEVLGTAPASTALHICINRCCGRG